MWKDIVLLSIYYSSTSKKPSPITGASQVDGYTISLCNFLLQHLLSASKLQYSSTLLINFTVGLPLTHFLSLILISCSSHLETIKFHQLFNQFQPTSIAVTGTSKFIHITTHPILSHHKHLIYSSLPWRIFVTVLHSTCLSSMHMKSWEDNASP